MDLQKFLEKIFDKVSKNISRLFVKNSTLRQKIEFICRCNSNKAPIRFLMSCLIAKIDKPTIDIRKPYTEIEGNDTYSGRFYDERFIESFVRKYKLPCNSITAYLTPAFRNIDRILTKEIALVGRPKEVYTYTIEILNEIYQEKEIAEDILQEIIRLLLIIKREDEKRMGLLVENLKQLQDSIPLSSEQIVILLNQHLQCKNSSRLPVLIVTAAYKTLEILIGEKPKQLQAHNAADKQTGSIGDIEIVSMNDKNIVTCYEIKDKRVTKNDIDLAIEKLNNKKQKIDNYIFITTDLIESEILDYANTLYDKSGVEFAVLDCIGFIRHFLHFFHRLRNKFLDIYQQLVIDELTSSVPQSLKEAFLSLRQVTESDH